MGTLETTSSSGIPLPMVPNSLILRRAGNGVWYLEPARKPARRRNGVVATVLVVDDHKDAADLLCRVIRSWGHGAFTAINAEVGLALVGTSRPDLLIVDGMMPGMNGIEFIRLLRSNSTTADLPAILYTAVSDARFHDHAIEKGANECWVKGAVPVEMMRKRIETYLLNGHGGTSD